MISERTTYTFFPRKRSIDQISDLEQAEDYLNDLESRLNKKFKPMQDFNDTLFMYSPHDSMLQAEELKTKELISVKRRLKKITKDVDEICEFMELLGQSKLI